MKKTLILVLVLGSFATSAAQKETKLCKRNQIDYLLEAQNRLSFTNSTLMKRVDSKLVRDKSQVQAGMFNTGFCWWHSRFNLNSSYVAIFDNPEGMKVSTVQDARKVFRKIRQGKIVKIKNFKNLYDLSKKYENLFRRELNQWQLGDTLKGRWVQGVKGKEKVSSKSLMSKARSLYQDFQRTGNPSFQILQMKGVAAHSAIVVDVKKVNPNREVYEIKTVDSSFPFPVVFVLDEDQEQTSARYDMKNFDVGRGHPELKLRSEYRGYRSEFVPYDSSFAKKEHQKLVSRLKEHCTK